MKNGQVLKQRDDFRCDVLMLCQFSFAGSAPLIPPSRGEGGCCLARHNFFDVVAVSKAVP